MTPRAFWALHPREFWWLVEVKSPRKQYGAMSEDEVADIYESAYGPGGRYEHWKEPVRNVG